MSLHDIDTGHSLTWLSSLFDSLCRDSFIPRKILIKNSASGKKLGYTIPSFGISKGHMFIAHWTSLRCVATSLEDWLDLVSPLLGSDYFFYFNDGLGLANIITSFTWIIGSCNYLLRCHKPKGEWDLWNVFQRLQLKSLRVGTCQRSGAGKEVVGV